jgi:hypothetical protein
MLHFNVRRLTAAVALVLVLAAAPALAAPGPRSHAAQPPVASLSLLEKMLDWLGAPAAASLPGVLSVFEKSTTTDSGTSATSRTTLNRSAQIDPNG